MKKTIKKIFSEKNIRSGKVKVNMTVKIIIFAVIAALLIASVFVVMKLVSKNGSDNPNDQSDISSDISGPEDSSSENSENDLSNIPKNLTLVGTILKWDAVDNSVSYNVYKDGVLFNTVNINECDLSSITDDNEHSLTVQAVISENILSEMSAPFLYKRIDDTLENPFLIFKSESPFTIKVDSPAWNGVMEYSTNAITWTEWNGSELSSVNSRIYIRGRNNTRVSCIQSGIYYPFRISGTKVECIGNIENLLDYEMVLNGEHPVMDNSCFAYMFYECTALISAPVLPAVELSESCYQFMFAGCTLLKTPPALPAIKLAENCYLGMFASSGLTTVPYLPATTLADLCYSYMFYQCTSLQISNIKTEHFKYEWRIPTVGTIQKTQIETYPRMWNFDMLYGTGNEVDSNPGANTTYYVASQPIN